MRAKLNKIKVSYKVTPLQKVKKEWSKKPSQSLSVAKSIAFEICGLSPYEKKAYSLLKADESRKCGRFLKKRLGSLRRAKRKQEEIAKMIREE